MMPQKIPRSRFSDKTTQTCSRHLETSLLFHLAPQNVR